MSIKSDRWIRTMAEEHKMIEPFEAGFVIAPVAFERDGDVLFGVGMVDLEGARVGVGGGVPPQVP